MFSFALAKSDQFRIAESQTVVNRSQVAQSHLVGIADVPLECPQCDARSLGQCLEREASLEHPNADDFRAGHVILPSVHLKWTFRAK